MIDAREIVKSIKLSAVDEAEVRRLGAEIVAAVRKPEYDGSPVPVQIPFGENEEQQARIRRLVLALQRRFQVEGWVVQVSTSQDAFGNPQNYDLWFAVDPTALRETAPQRTSAPVEARFSLRAMYEELGTIFGDVVDVPPLPDKPVLSVLLGTYNRLSLLRRAIRSIRFAVASLLYEIVVVDGGSTDGTRTWLASQSDVLLVAEHRLEGAVRAFNQGFTLCRGEFVANANDDIGYEKDVLAKGVEHLREHPEVGQVAFALRGEGENWVINEVHPGKSGTIYANHGVVRKSVADQIAYITGGFWPPVYHTYAGDCEHSAWVWRLGYQVVALPHLRVLDSRPNDALRERNQARFGVDTKRMYARWPAASFRPDGSEPRVTELEIARYRQVVGAGKVLAEVRTTPDAVIHRGDALTTFVELVGFPEPQEERRLRKAAPLLRALDPVEGQFPRRAEKVGSERVLHVHINGRDAVDQQEGLVRALMNLAGVDGMRGRGLSEPCILQRENGEDTYACVRWPDLPFREREEQILRAAKDVKPTLVFMQLQAPGAVDVETIRKLRGVAPEAVIATWCGDVAECNSPWQTEWQVQLGRLVDLTLHSSMTHVRALRAAGVHNAAYFQIGYDEQQYTLLGKYQGANSTFPSAPPGIDYDVSFLGNRYGKGDPFSSTYRWRSGVPAHDSALRDEVVVKMRDAFGGRFGLFGSGWDGAEPPISPVSVTKSHEVYQRSRIGLSVSLDNKLECYSSDRLFRILGCGTVLLVKRFPGMSVLGLEDRKNCVVFDTADDAVAWARKAIDDPIWMRRVAEQGAKLARENHTWGVRMLELMPYFDVIRAARR